MRPRAILPALLLVTTCAVTAAACRHESPRGPAPPQARKGSDLPTVEVAPPPDAKIDVSRDAQEHRHAETFAGVLPGGFPKGLPLPPQASLVDQGRAWVELLVPRRPAAVREPYLQQLRGAGWQVTSAGADAWGLRRGGSAVRLQLRAQGPSTRLRLSY